MASETNIVCQAADPADLLIASATRKATTGSSASPIARIRTKTSSLPEEQRDKLLFEVFDMLLGKDAQSTELSPVSVATTKKQCKVKGKVATVPYRLTKQSKEWPSTRQS